AVSNVTPGMDLTSNRVGSGRSRTICPRESQVSILSLMSSRNDLQGANSVDSERMGIRVPDTLSHTLRSDPQWRRYLFGRQRPETQVEAMSWYWRFLLMMILARKLSWTCKFIPELKAADRLPAHELSAVNGHCLRFKYSATLSV